MAYYRQVGSVPPKRHTQHRGPDGRAAVRGTDGRGGLLLRLVAAVPRATSRRRSSTRRRGNRPTQRPCRTIRCNRATSGCPRCSATTRGRTPTWSPGGAWCSATPTCDCPTWSPARRPPCTATRSATSACTSRPARASVETFFGALPVRTGDFVAPAARHHAPVDPGARRAAAAYCIESATHIAPPEALPVAVRPVAGARPVLRARPARADRTAARRGRRRGGARQAPHRRAASPAPGSCTRSTRSTWWAGTAASTRTRSTSATSSRSPAACTSRRRCTRSSRAPTSSSATSCRARSTTTRCRSRCRTTTRTSTPTRCMFYVRRRLRGAQGLRHRAGLGLAASGWAYARPAARRVRAQHRRGVLRRARRHGRHVPPARTRRGRPAPATTTSTPGPGRRGAARDSQTGSGSTRCRTARSPRATARRASASGSATRSSTCRRLAARAARVLRALVAGAGPEPAPGRRPRRAGARCARTCRPGLAQRHRRADPARRRRGCTSRSRSPTTSTSTASEHHATNVGRIFRPGLRPAAAELEAPADRLPRPGRHGRGLRHRRRAAVAASARRPTSRRRPSGRRGGSTSRPRSASSSARRRALGSPVPVGAFAEHVFGVCLLNDWSARDIQAWEYVPLGPVPRQVVRDLGVGRGSAARRAGRARRVARRRATSPLLPYLDDAGAEPCGLDLAHRGRLNGRVVSRPPFATMYWTAAQQLAHMTVNGATLRTGDLYGSGTVSGPRPGAARLAAGAVLGRARRDRDRRPASAPSSRTATRWSSGRRRPARTARRRRSARCPAACCRRSRRDRAPTRELEWLRDGTDRLSGRRRRVAGRRFRRAVAAPVVEPRHARRAPRAERRRAGQPGRLGPHRRRDADVRRATSSGPPTSPGWAPNRPSGSGPSSSPVSRGSTTTWPRSPRRAGRHRCAPRAAGRSPPARSRGCATARSGCTRSTWTPASASTSSRRTCWPRCSATRWG